MALNKLKKWVGTQLWSTFMTEYNENIDELNRVISEMEENISLFDGNVIKTIYDTGTSMPRNVLQLNWDSLPVNITSERPATLLVLRAAGSNLGLAVVIKNSSITGTALLITASGVSTHTLSDGVWS